MSISDFAISLGDAAPLGIAAACICLVGVFGLALELAHDLASIASPGPTSGTHLPPHPDKAKVAK